MQNKNKRLSEIKLIAMTDEGGGVAISFEAIGIPLLSINKIK